MVNVMGERREAEWGGQEEVPGALAEDVIQQVKNAFYIVAAEPGADLVPLKSIKVTLKTVLEWTIGGGPKFKVPFIDVELSLGYSITHERLQTIEIELVPPGEKDEAIAASEPLAPQLAEALRVIRRTVQVAAVTPPVLELSEGSIELDFVVTREGKAELLIFSGDRKDVTTQSLLVTVGHPE